MRVVLSIGGSVLAPDLDPDRVRAHAATIGDLDDEGHEVGVVVGGGAAARDYIGAARELGANEMALDRLGIGVTRLNARLLIAALGEAAVTAPPEDYEAAAAALKRGEIPVMGGMAPAQTTDAVAAVLAEFVGADRLVYATSVSGVFDADPEADPDAERFDELSAADLVELSGGTALDAGSRSPVDPLAAKVIRRAGLDAVVLDGSDPANVGRAVRDGSFEGTRIVPGGR